MPPSLADRFREAHRDRFVGRVEELATFEKALDASPPPFSVLYIHGPGGVGKSALLRELTYRCTERNLPVVSVNGEEFEPTPSAFVDALKAEGLDPAWLPPEEGGGEAAPDADGGEQEPADRTVLMIDTFEAISRLGPWMRRAFLPQLPADWLVVVAGRDAPPESWRADLGLSAVLKRCPLRNLPESTAREYLRKRDVPTARTEEIVAFTRGHPLALSLAADSVLQDPNRSFDPDEEPDLIDALVRRFLSDVSNAPRREAVEAASLVRFATKPLLETVLDATPETVSDLFEWLHHLSFVQAQSDGLRLHPVVRSAVLTDLRWRDRDRFNLMRDRAKTFYLSGLEQSAESHPRTTRRRLIDTLYLYRRNPVVQPFFRRLRAEWNASPVLQRTEARPDDRAALAAMVRRHEGDASADLFARWVDHAAATTHVIREDAGPVRGFVMTLELTNTSAQDRDADPAVDAAWKHLQNTAPLRDGENAALFRFWMADESYQDISPVQSLISAFRVRYYLTAPDLAYTFVPAADPGRWRTLFAYGGLDFLENATFEVGGSTYGLFGHDWRAVPPADWLSRLADRTLSPLMPDLREQTTERLAVLSRSDFDSAVKESLKAYARPHDLRDSPLLRSRIVAVETGLDADRDRRIEALRSVLAEAAKEMQADPKTADHYRAVRATYLDPRETQEKAAEDLDLPFSTYRRYLRKGIEHITDALWRAELG